MRRKMEEGGYKRLVFWLSLSLCATFFILFLYLGHTYYCYEDEMLKKAENQTKVQAQNSAMKIGSKFSEVVSVAESISNDLSSGRLEGDGIIQRMNATMEENPDLNGICIAYTPYAFNPKKELYAPYLTYLKMDGNLQLVQIEDRYDYTQPDDPRTEWYHKPLAEGPLWTEPYFGTVDNQFVVDYEVPFYPINALSEEKSPRGIVDFSYSLYGVRGIVASLNPSDTGYGFIVTEKGNIVSHPISEYLGKNMSYLEKTMKICSR